MFARLFTSLALLVSAACSTIGFDSAADLEAYVDRAVAENGGDPIRAYDAILSGRPWPAATRREFIVRLVDRHSLVDEHASAKPGLKNENVLIGPELGLKSRHLGRFRGVVRGERGDADSKYLWTLDHRGINIALENTPFPTPRGVIVHSNLSGKAYVAGEAWFDGNKVTINAGSGRFGDRSGVPPRVFAGAIRIWQHLGYEVEAIPFGER